MNIRYVGRTKEEQIQHAHSLAMNKWQTAVKNYFDDLDKRLSAEPDDPSWYHYMLLTPRFIQAQFDGGLSGVAGVVHMGASILAKLYNDMRWYINTDTNLALDMSYAFSDWSVSAVESTMSTVMSGTAQLGRVVGIDPDWAFDETLDPTTQAPIGMIPRVAEWADQQRLHNKLNDPYFQNEFERNRIEAMNRVGTPPQPVDGHIDQEAARNYQRELYLQARTKLIEDHYFEETEAFVRNSAEFNRMLTEDIIRPTVSKAFFEIDKTIDPMFEHNEFYNFMIGSFESIGNILVSWTLGSIGAKYGIPTWMTRSYFGASVFGRSHAEAIQAGSSMRDAYTFAMARTATEVLAQNLGGLKTWSPIPRGVRENFQSFADSGITRLIKDMFVEGFEEFLIESGRAGQYYYVGEERSMAEHIGTDEELLKNLAYAFLAGSMASGVLAGGRNIYLQTTMPNVVERHAEAFNIDVQKYGEEYAVKRLDRSMKIIIETLNNERAKGQKVGSNGVPYIGVLTLNEKIAWLNQTQLKQYIEVENGQFRIKDGVEFTTDMFNNKINNKNIVDADYAISKNVRGRELNVKVGKKRTVKPIKTKRLNKVGKAAIEYANENNLTVVVYSSKSNEKGFLGENGVIYINQNQTDSTDNAVATVIKHEMVHKLQELSPEFYERMQEEIDDIIYLRVDKDGEVDVRINSPELERFLQSKKYKDNILRSLTHYLAEADSIETAVTMTQNEILPYLIEAMLDGSDASTSLTTRKQSLMREMLSLYQRNHKLRQQARQNKYVRQQLNKVQKAYNQGVRQVKINENRVSYFTQNMVGGDISQMINWSLLKKNYNIEKNEENEQKLLEAFQNDYDFETGRINVRTIGDKVIEIPIWDFINSTQDIVPKRLSSPDYSEIYKNTKVHPTKHRNLYRKLLWEYVEVQNEIIDMIIQENGGRVKESQHLWRPYQQKATFADYVHNSLDKVQNIQKPSHVKLIRELLATDEFHKQEFKYRQRSTGHLQTLETRATMNAIQRVVRYFNTKTGLKGWRNATHTLEGPSVAKWNYEVQQNQNAFEAAEGMRGAIDMLLMMQFPNEYQVSYSVYNVIGENTEIYFRNSQQGSEVSTVTQDNQQINPWDQVFQVTSQQYVEFHIVPTDQLIQDNVRKLETKLVNQMEQETVTRDVLTDNLGNEVSPYLIRRFRNTVVKNDNDQLQVVYHGSDKAFFNKFAPAQHYAEQGLSEQVNFFADTRSIAEFYAQTDQSVPTEIVQRYDTIKAFIEAIRSTDAEVFENISVVRVDGKYQLVELENGKVNYVLGEYENRTDLLNNAFEDIFIHQYQADPSSTGGIHSAYLNITNPYTIDVEGKAFNEILDPDGPGTTETTIDVINRIIESNKTQGTEYDGVIFENIQDPTIGTVYVTIQNQDQIQLVQRQETVSQKTINNQFIEDVFAFFADNSILHGNLFLTRDNLNVFEITPENIILPEGFNQNNVVVGMPNFEKNAEVQTLQDASKLAPVVALAVPMIWKESFTYQSKAPSNLKLVFNEPYNPGVHLIGHYPTQLSTRLVGQIWVHDSDARFKNLPNLRKQQNDPMRHEDFKYYAVDRPEAFDAYRNVDYDIAIQSRGPAKEFTIKQKGEPLDTSKSYYFIKANNSKALEILQNIDYNQLALYGSKSFVGFNSQDLVREYTRQKQTKVAPKSLQQFELTAEDRATIRSAFGEDYISQFFVKDTQGRLVLKNRKMVEAKKRANKITINNNDFDTSEYAMSLNFYQNNNFDISSFDNMVFVKQSEMSNIEKLLFETFRELDISFVFYKNKGQMEEYGFSSTSKDSFITFINTQIIETERGRRDLSQKILSTLIHEEMHEMYKRQPSKMEKFGKDLSGLLFEQGNTSINPYTDAQATNILEAIIDVAWEGKTERFLQYLRSGYPDMRNVKRLVDVQNILEHQKIYFKNGKSNTVSNNEMIAQILGYLFSDTNVINSIFAEKNVPGINAYNLYTKLMENATDVKTKKFLQNAFKNFEVIRQEHTDVINQTFNKPQRYTHAELNQFINDFTDGQFTTRSALLKAFFQETINKKRGSAKIALDNILFIAEQFGKMYKHHVENFHILRNEFIDYQHEISYILNSKDTATFLKSEPFQKFQELEKIFGKKGKTKLLKELFDTKMLNTQQINNIIEHLNDVLLKLDTLDYAYANLNERILRYFGMPDTLTLSTQATELRWEIQKLINAIQSNKTIAGVKKIDFNEYINKILQFLNEDAVALGKNAVIDNETLRLIQQQMETNHVSRVNRIYENIMRDTAKVLKQFERKREQRGSPYHKEIQAVVKAIQTFANLLKDNMYDLTTGSPDVRSQMVEQIKIIESTIENSSRLTPQEIERIQSDLMPQLYYHLGVLLQDKTIITDKYFNDEMDVIRSLEDYSKMGINDKQISKDFAAVLKAVETIYTTSLSNYTMTRDQFVQRTNEQINRLPKSIKPKTIAKMAHVIPTQNFLRFFKNVTDGKVDLFNAVYEQYIEATHNAESLLVDFQQKYKRYIRENKHHIDHANSRVDLSSDVFVNMENKDAYIQKQQEIQKQIDKQQDRLSEYKKSLEAWKKDITDAEAKIKHSQRIISKTNDKNIISDENFKIIKNESAIETAKNEVRLHYKSIMKIKDNLRTLSSEEVLIQESMIKQVSSENYVDANLSRAELISLYLSIKREVEMHQRWEEGNTDIAPTNHFESGNHFELYDVQKAALKGYRVAKSDMAVVALRRDRQTTLDYLETVLTDIDFEIISFTQERMDANYEFVNEIFKKQYQVDLPRQETYISYITADGDMSREFHLKTVNRHNQAMDTRMTKQTMHHASQALRISNIYDVLEMSTRRSAMYSYDPLVKDFQAAMETPIGEGRGKQSLKSKFENTGNKIGDDNRYYETFQKAIEKIIAYGDPSESDFEKLVRRITALGVSATVGLNIPMAFKQLPTITTTLIKMGRPDLIPRMTVNVMKSLGPSKYRSWLMSEKQGEGNDLFWSRTEQGNLVQLLDTMPLGALRGTTDLVKKTGYKLGYLVGRFDNATLVGAFRTFAEDYRMKNPQATETEVMNHANNELNEMFLWGIASFNPAFRAPFSTNKRAIERIVGRFMSENILQFSAMIEHIAYWQNTGFRDLHAAKEATRHFSALFVSALLSSIVNIAAGAARGYTDLDEDNIAFEFFVNQLIWNNMMGVIPYLNQFTSMVQFEIPTANEAGQRRFIRRGFSFRVPLFDDVASLIQIIDSMQNGENLERKTLRAFEVFGQLTGIPIRNATRIARSAANIFGSTGNNTAMEVTQFLNSTTNQQAFNEAIKKGRVGQINRHIEQVYTNEPLQNEIARILTNNPDLNLRLYNDPYFRVRMSDGSFKRIDIPENLHKHYNAMTQRALSQLILRFEYRRLSDEEKLKAIQRVINYYNRHLREDVQGNRAHLMSAVEVVNHSLRYANY